MDGGAQGVCACVECRRKSVKHFLTMRDTLGKARESEGRA